MCRNEKVPILIKAAEEEQSLDIVTSSLPSNAKRADSRRKNTLHNGS